MLTVGLVNQDAQASSFVEGVVVVDVDAADGLPAFGQVDHQAKLLLRRYVVVVQQKLLDLKAGIWRMCATHPPDVTVVFPAVDPLGVFWLGATQCDDVIFDDVDNLRLLNSEFNTSLSLKRGVLIDIIYTFIFYLLGSLSFIRKDIRS